MGQGAWPHYGRNGGVGWGPVMAGNQGWRGGPIIAGESGCGRGRDLIMAGELVAWSTPCVANGKICAVNRLSKIKIFANFYQFCVHSYENLITPDGVAECFVTLSETNTVTYDVHCAHI